MEITSLDQLDLNKSYTYADYLMWKFKERVELFKGKILKMSPAPAKRHQLVAGNLYFSLRTNFSQKSCQLFIAPFDVRLPSADGTQTTVVQPDLCVICDPEKLDNRGAIGAPDLVVEILSPGNSKKEMGLKFSLYEESGVREYWMVDPTERCIYIYVLENGIYIGKKPVIEDENLVSYIFPELNFPAIEIFKNIE